MKKTALVLALLAAAPAIGVTFGAPDASYAQPKPKPLTKADVIKMSKAGIPDSVIISKIQNSGSVFKLEVSDILALKKAGVTDKVIEAMVATEMSAGRPASTPRPTARPGGTPATATEEENILGVSPPDEIGEEPAWGGTAGTLPQAAALFRDKKWPQAADMLFNLLENNKVESQDRPEATLRLADSLYNLGLFQSANSFYGDVVKMGTNTRAFGPALKRVIELSDKLKDDRRLLNMLQDIEPGKLPVELRRDAGYYYGILSFRKEDFDAARRFLRTVTKDSPFYAKAQYSLGVILSLEANDNQGLQAAMNAFREAFTSADSAKGKSGDDFIAQEARLAVARTLYGVERYAEAVKVFEEIDRDSEQWGQSLFDNAWARYKSQDFGGALGNVLSTKSPFFDTFYEPEGKILEAIVYYRLCLFGRADKTINDFFRDYSPYQAKVKAFLKQARERQPEQVFAFLKDFVDSPKGTAATFMPNDLMVAVAEDGKISGILFQLNTIDYEQKLIRDSGQFRQTRAASAVNDIMNGRKDGLRKLGGRLIVLEFEDQEQELNRLFAEAKTIRFEITLGEKEALEASLLGKGSDAATGRTKEASIVVPDDHYYWPFEGEYWKDEVGYYKFAVTGECVK